MKNRRRQAPARNPLQALIRRNIHLLSRRKHHGIISSSFQEKHGYKDDKNHDCKIDNKYESEKTMLKLSLTNSLSESSGSVVLEEEEQDEHSILVHSHKQSTSIYISHSIPDAYDSEIESRHDDHIEEKIEGDQWEWSVSGMSAIERDWKDINSLTFRKNSNKTPTEKKSVMLKSEVSVHDLTKRANDILGLLLQQERSSMLPDCSFPNSTPLPNKTFRIQNDNSGYTDEHSYESDNSSQGDNDEIALNHDNISTVSSMTFATAYTSSSFFTQKSIVDLKIKKRRLEQKIEEGFQRARCRTVIPSSVQFVE